MRLETKLDQTSDSDSSSAIKPIKTSKPTIEQTLKLNAKPHTVRKWLLLSALGVVLLAAVAWWLSLPNADKAPSYQTQTIQRGDIRATVAATGTLQPTNKVEVGSELSGKIDEVFVDFNDTVTKGQLLARLNTDKLHAQTLQAQAALQVANATVLQANATLEEAQAHMVRMHTIKKLSDGKLPSQADFLAAQAQLKRAQSSKAMALAEVEKAKATLELYQTDMAKTDIVSPINGVVLIRSIERGQTVAATMSAPILFTLAEDLSRMELQVDVDEADVGLVKAGQTASFTVDAYPNVVFPAQIKQVRFGSQTTNGVVTYTTLLEVNNPDLTLRPGMTASADVLVKEKADVLLIPQAALRFTPDVLNVAPRAQKV
ncbi:efflux RND transporter periplasmic adaptor subunit [Thiomicrorhabdus aquaedulcis]|uniref:efflux RND transporter periplasmic adaptor subunit n=1 Tax=Thiomicrorhabdus aquaedulcis TaxID=2211106 RepID=UPI000FD9A59F|nr:efflux RND transporter periplasmic adaptor subunit [Thiomicrorhabdus aquaedulcis]